MFGIEGVGSAWHRFGKIKFCGCPGRRSEAVLLIVPYMYFDSTWACPGALSSFVPGIPLLPSVFRQLSLFQPLEDPLHRIDSLDIRLDKVISAPLTGRRSEPAPGVVPASSGTA